MAKNIRNRKGQFSIIAAVLLAIVLVVAVVTTYSMINFSLPKEQTNILSSIDETNISLKQMLEFAVGYYCSVLQVTGNATFAYESALDYLNSGLEFIANSHPEWNPSFQLVSINFSTQWYEISSYSMGSLHIIYNLSSIGVSNIVFSTYCSLSVNIVNVTDTNVRVNVLKDENITEQSLSSQNFIFYYYDNSTSEWMPITSSSIISQDSQYIIEIPTEVDKSCFLLRVLDSRGITATSFYSTSRRPQYTYVFNWNATGMGNIYSQLNYDKIVIEVLQNGTLRWLGQKLLDGKPIPPIPVKCIRVSANSNFKNLEERQIPFQVEDWASDYTVPLGRSNKETKISYGNMIVFLVDHTIKNVTIWWDGRDLAEQTSYAIQRNFDDHIQSSGEVTIDNGVITVTINYESGDFYITTSTCRADFMRINGHDPKFYASPSFPIINGTVRDIIQQEAEWPNYSYWGFPNTYAQIVITVPANATYYTYAIRPIFVNASTCPENRTLTELTPIIITQNGNFEVLAENGTSNQKPIAVQIRSGSQLFYNFSDGKWEHHWSQFVSGGVGAGIMFTNSDNLKLYYFDDIAGQQTGALKVINNRRSVTIEFSPVNLHAVSFDYPIDITWFGAVVSIENTDLIYDSSSPDNVGLWIIVEHPPEIQVIV